MFFIPFETAITPAEGHCFVDRWWMVHPEKGVAFYATKRRSYELEPGEEDEPSPQCNSSESTARHLQQKLHPDCETRFIPVVFVRHAITEMHRQRRLVREQARVVNDSLAMESRK
jgi:hypothetical protein